MESICCHMHRGVQVVAVQTSLKMRFKTVARVKALMEKEGKERRMGWRASDGRTESRERNGGREGGWHGQRRKHSRMRRRAFQAMAWQATW